MTKKIIVADDSQTIQKVIKITFAKHEHELVSCVNEAELFNAVKSRADLILLDFSLSDKKSGYELAQEIRKYNQNTPIMALLGTFDSVDEITFVNAGYSDKVVKPFETEKFLKKCDQLLSGDFELASVIDLQDSYDDWDINSPDVEVENELEEKEDEELIDNSSDELSSELGGWGFNPNDLAARDLTNDYPVFPPVIEDSKNIASKFLSASTLVPEIEDEDGNEGYVEEATREIELEIEKEMEVESELENDLELNEADIDANDFWSVDEGVENEEDLEAELEYEDYIALESDGDDSDENQDFMAEGHFNPKVDHSMMNGDMNESIKNAIKQDLEPIVQKYVEQYCRDNIEKIMWEIIPDLAENIIRKEIKEISRNVVKSIEN